jgi:hypothetical protein
MSCFWDGLSAAILAIIPTHLRQRGTFTNQDLFKFLKKHNQLVKNVRVNNETITDQQQRENFEAIQGLSINSLPNGYWCSTCDPVLILVSQLFNVDIEHKYLGVRIFYKNIGVTDPTRVIRVASDYGHFWKA